MLKMLTRFEICGESHCMGSGLESCDDDDDDRDSRIRTLGADTFSLSLSMARRRLSTQLEHDWLLT